MALRLLRRLLRIGSLERGDFTSERERSVGNVDAAAEAAMRDWTPGTSGSPGYPPGYVKDYDEGRPRK